jgi:hypothetical protein
MTLQRRCEIASGADHGWMVMTVGSSVASVSIVRFSNIATGVGTGH